jgi:hypothetical protein
MPDRSNRPDLSYRLNESQGARRVGEPPIVWQRYRGTDATQWMEWLRSRPDCQSAHELNRFAVVGVSA